MVTYTSIVKGATKIKLAPPKEKYLTPILIGCSSSSKDTQDILFLLHKRLTDSAFTICYKSLIVLHYILNECNNTDNKGLLKYTYNEFLSSSSKKDYYCRASESDLLALKRYKEYLFARISLSYHENRNKDLVDEGYLEILKKNNLITDSKNKIDIEKIINTIKLQIECIGKLLKNKYSIHDLTNTNNLLLTCFKLLTNDLLVLYNILNEGIITILESFFELKLEIQKETCELYDDFVMITEDVVKYLKIGKQCGLRIPVIKHITTKLSKSLREHLTSGDNINNKDEKSNASTSAKEQLERVRKQRQLLESQLRITSNDLSTPQLQQQQHFTGFSPQQQVPQQTGTNPFLMNSIPEQAVNNAAVLQQQPSSNNVFAQQTPTNNVFLQQQFSQPNQSEVQQVQQTGFQQPQQTGFQQPQQTGFQQPQQTGFQQPQQTGFQQPQQTGFQQPQQTGFQQPQQTGFQQPQQTGLQQPQQTGLQQPQQTGLQQPQQTGFQQPQQTNNVFLQNPQQTQLSQQQSFATNLVPQQTNNPFFTQQQPSQQQHAQLQPQPTQSLNPFSMQNVQQENLKRQETNPFSLTNQPEIQNKLVNNNPFGLQNQQQVFTNVQPQQQFTGFAQQQQFTGYNQQQQNGQQPTNQGFSLIDL